MIWSVVFCYSNRKQTAACTLLSAPSNYTWKTPPSGKELQRQENFWPRAGVRHCDLGMEIRSGSREAGSIHGVEWLDLASWDKVEGGDGGGFSGWLHPWGWMSYFLWNPAGQKCRNLKGLWMVLWVELWTPRRHDRVLTLVLVNMTFFGNRVFAYEIN